MSQLTTHAGKIATARGTLAAIHGRIADMKAAAHPAINADVEALEATLNDEAARIALNGGGDSFLASLGYELALAKQRLADEKDQAQ